MTLPERLTVLLLEHPRARRALAAMTSVYLLCGWALISAPAAAASTGAAMLGWTGLKDSDGVPLKDMFLSVVDTTEAVTNNGQEVTMDPTTWLKWLSQAGQTATSHGIITWVLTNEAAAIVFGASLAFWFLRFAMSNAYLLALATVARPVDAAVRALVNSMWLGPSALALCLIVAVRHHRAGRTGQAWSVIGNAAILLFLLLTIFRNPIDDELTSDHGLLGMARFTGFQIGQSLHGGSYAPGQNLDGQLNALLSQLISDTVRPMIQLMNFGMVVDTVPGCRQAWNTAIMAANGQGPGPAHAMAPDPSLGHHMTLNCHAPQAFAHAQQLGAFDTMGGVMFLAIGAIIGFFIYYVGISNLVVGAKATYYGIAVTPAFLLGMTGWQRARNYASRCGNQMLLHGAQTIIFTAFLAISAVGMGFGLSTRMLGPAEGSAVPRLLLVGVGSIVALLVFRYIDKHFYTDSVGTIAHHWRMAYNSGRDRAKSDYDDFQDGIDKVRDAHNRFRNWRRGDQKDEADTDGAIDDVPGFDVVKPRPTRRMGETSPTPAPAASETVESTAGEVASTAARRGAATEVAAGAAESAATVLAPEVALPAAAIAGAVQHSRHNHESAENQPNQAPAQREPESSSTNWSPNYSDTDWSPTGDSSENLSMAPTSATRPTNTHARHAAPDASRGGTPEPDPDATAPSADQDPPLEFPPAQPRPTARKGDPA